STLASIERQLTLFHDTRRALGKPRATDIPLLKECVVAEDATAALADARPFLEAKYKAYQRWNQDDALPKGETFDLPFEELARGRGRAPAGPPTARRAPPARDTRPSARDAQPAPSRPSCSARCAPADPRAPRAAGSACSPTPRRARRAGGCSSTRRNRRRAR